MLIARSAVARGVVTAVNWLRPFKFHCGVVPTWQEALTFMGKFRTEPGVRDALELLPGRATGVPIRGHAIA